MTCNDPVCREKTIFHNADLAEEYLRDALAESPHLSVSYDDLLTSVMIAMHRTTGVRYTPDDMMSVLAEATRVIDAGYEAESFETQTLADIEALPVADVPPRVLISRADVEAIAVKVAELLRAGNDDRGLSGHRGIAGQAG